MRGTTLYDKLDQVDDLLNSPKHKYLSNETFADNHVWYTQRRLKNFTTVDGESFTKDYSQLYTMEICEDELDFEEKYEPLIEGADRQYDAHHLFFITVCVPPVHSLYIPLLPRTVCAEARAPVSSSMPKRHTSAESSGWANLPLMKTPPMTLAPSLVDR